jgi:hypothetical protein
MKPYTAVKKWEMSADEESTCHDIMLTYLINHLPLILLRPMSVYDENNKQRNRRKNCAYLKFMQKADYWIDLKMYKKFPGAYAGDAQQIDLLTAEATKLCTEIAKDADKVYLPKLLEVRKRNRAAIEKWLAEKVNPGDKLKVDYTIVSRMAKTLRISIEHLDKKLPANVELQNNKAGFKGFGFKKNEVGVLVDFAISQKKKEVYLESVYRTDFTCGDPLGKVHIID